MPPRMAAWNTSRCVEACFCTSGDLPPDRDSCSLCTSGDVGTRTNCCGSCCERAVYLTLVYSGDLSAFFQTSGGSYPALDNAITLFLRALFGAVATGTFDLPLNFVRQILYTPGSIIAEVQFEPTVPVAAVQEVADQLVQVMNAGGDGTLNVASSTGMTTLDMLSVGASTTQGVPAPAAPGYNPNAGSSAGSCDDDDDGLDGGAIAGIVIGVLLLCCFVAAAVWYFAIRGAGGLGGGGSFFGGGQGGQSSGNADVDLADWATQGALAAFGLALIFAIAGTASDTMVVFPYGDDGDGGVGAWTWSIEMSTAETTWSGDTCEFGVLFASNNFEAPDEAKRICYDSMVSKCRAGKAFSVIGILALVVAILGVAVNFPGRTLVTKIGAGIAIFSFMMVWALWAALFNGEVPGFLEPGLGDPTWCDSDSASCGFGGGDEDSELSYGAAFGLYVTAWLLVIIGTGLAVFKSTCGGGSNPYRGNTSGRVSNPAYADTVLNRNSVAMAENPLARTNSAA